MTYKEAVEYLYNQTPLFQNNGAGAYKEGLFNTYALDEHFDHPHRRYKTIHIAGTNGKGSCSHLIASVLQEAGYKVGLYTSPHLLDFRERIRVNGEMISEDYVVSFIEKERSFFEPLYPSFFEVATAMAFKYFADKNIDVAVVEVGLGGRLDCTNIISPVLSVITNISFDHVALLGNTLQAIACEKAGIMKSCVPTVVGEYVKSTKTVFEEKSVDVGCPLIFAQDNRMVRYSRLEKSGGLTLTTYDYGRINCGLGGIYQRKNANTVLNAIPYLTRFFPDISLDNVAAGFEKVKENTGLMGRWQKVKDNPMVICDTGHNTGGFKYIVRQLSLQKYKTLRIIIGMVNDKDIDGVLSMLPTEAEYYFTQASVARALNHEMLRQKAESHNLNGRSFPIVAEAYKCALTESGPDDFIYVGGSTFIVADLLKGTSIN